MTAFVTISDSAVPRMVLYISAGIIFGCVGLIGSTGDKE